MRKVLLSFACHSEYCFSVMFFHTVSKMSVPQQSYLLSIRMYHAINTTNQHAHNHDNILATIQMFQQRIINITHPRIV